MLKVPTHHFKVTNYLHIPFNQSLIRFELPFPAYPTNTCAYTNHSGSVVE